MKFNQNYFAKLLIPLLLILASFTVQIQAQVQKCGHVNSNELLEAMPEWKEAERSIETLQTQLKSQYDSKISEYQQFATSLQEKVNAGTIAQAELDTEKRKLFELEQSIAKFELDLQQQILKREESLLAPIITKAQDAIKMVAEENGFTYVFDTTIAGALLYAMPSEDITALVKAKL